MPPTVIARPRPGDYSPYYDRYLAALPEGEVLSLLELGLEKLEILLGELTEAQAEYR
jgi:hypothetical protein